MPQSSTDLLMVVGFPPGKNGDQNQTFMFEMLIGLYVVYIKGCMKETEVDIFTPVNYLSI